MGPKQRRTGSLNLPGHPSTSQVTTITGRHIRYTLFIVISLTFSMSTLVVIRPAQQAALHQCSNGESASGQRQVRSRTVKVMLFPTLTEEKSSGKQRGAWNTRSSDVLVICFSVVLDQRAYIGLYAQAYCTSTLRAALKSYHCFVLYAIILINNHVLLSLQITSQRQSRHQLTTRTHDSVQARKQLYCPIPVSIGT